MRVVLEIDAFVTDDYYLKKVVDLPFAPTPGLGLMVGESAWWQQLTVRHSTWFTRQQEFRCSVEIDDVGDHSPHEIEDALKASGWLPS